jgi:hypothetical protein
MSTVSMPRLAPEMTRSGDHRFLVAAFGADPCFGAENVGNRRISHRRSDPHRTTSLRFEIMWNHRSQAPDYLSAPPRGQSVLARHAAARRRHEGR